MSSYSRVVVLGRLTRDVELRRTPNGTSVTEISVAINDRRKDSSGQMIDKTTFVDVTLWQRTAEIAAEYLSKGSPVLIDGRLETAEWEKDGQKRSKLRVVGENLRMLGGKSRESEAPQDEPQEQPAANGSRQPQGGGDDIPFAWLAFLIPALSSFVC